MLCTYMESEYQVWKKQHNLLGLIFKISTLEILNIEFSRGD
jgi:hypothetical protein